jgi:hypothetical protein
MATIAKLLGEAPPELKFSNMPTHGARRLRRAAPGHTGARRRGATLSQAAPTSA